MPNQAPFYSLHEVVAEPALAVPRSSSLTRNASAGCDSARFKAKCRDWLNLGLWTVICFCLASMTGLPAHAQLDQGAMSGIVVDTSGAVIPGATVTLTDTATNLALVRKTNGSGIFVFSPIKIGHYQVSASAKGFQTTVQRNLTVNIQGNPNIKLVLQPGAISQTITVTTAPPLLQTESASVGQVMSAKTINHTPLQGRNWVFMAQLTAGVVAAKNGRGGATGDFSANGQTPEQNNFILDGVDNNVNILDFQNGASYSVRPPPEALAQFKVQTTDYSAQFGHSAGAVLNASIKSGTNHVHGSAWEYARNDALDASNWNAPTKPPYKENQFGATLGFPILKNRLFYFGDAQETRISMGSTSLLTVPTALMRQGNFTELLDKNLTGDPQSVHLYEPNSGGATPLTCNGQENVLCPSQINPTAQNILTMYPMPNTNGGKTYQNFTENLSNKDNTWQFDQRIDWNISAKDQAYGRFSYNHEQLNNAPPLGPILDGTGDYRGISQNFLSETGMVSETHTFGANLVNEFRFSYNWGSFSNLQANSEENIAEKLGFGGIPFGEHFPHNGGLPNVAVGGITTFGSHNYDPAIQGQNVYQILDNVTKIAGKHTLHFGVSFQSFRDAALVPAQSRGDYSFNGRFTSDLGKSYTGSGIADFLVDQMNSATISTETFQNLARWYDAAYFQDDWKLTDRLTLNLGLRYSYFQPNKETAGRQANFVVSSKEVGTGSGTYYLPAKVRSVQLPATFTDLMASQNVGIQYLNNIRVVSAQTKNFAPRIGFAFRLNPKTVVRGGYGLFYGGLQAFGSPVPSNNYPFYTTASFASPSCAPNDCPSNGISIKTGFQDALDHGLQTFVSLPGFNATDPTIKTPYTEGYNLTVQRAITNSLVASVGYVGNVGRHLPTARNVNDAMALQNPANSARSVYPFPKLNGIDDIMYSGESNYNSLQATVKKQFGSGLSFLATYTWSHALDNSGDPLGGGIGARNINLIPNSYEYTDSGFDIPQRFTFNGYYQLPFGLGRPHMNQSRLLNTVLGDWAANITFNAQSGNPFTIGPNNTGVSGGSRRAILVGDPNAAGGSPNPTNPNISCPAKVRTKEHWYNPCAFANPESGSNIPRTGAGSKVTGLNNALLYLGGPQNQIFTPGNRRIDMSIFKQFPTWREQYLQFRADIFNVLNHPSLNTPSIGGINSNAGKITGPRLFARGTNAPDARYFQLSLKYVF